MTRHVTHMTIYDVEHYTDEERERIIESYPLHERDARAKGVPQLGSGRVFPVPEERLRTEAFAIPPHWPQIGGMDFGWDHPFAAVVLAWDREGDIVYVTHEYRIRQEPPSIHGSAMRGLGDIPWAWPHDGLQHDKGSGRPLADFYREQGLDLLPDKATHETGGFDFEAGIFALLERMKANRFRVFDHLSQWFEEYRLYHRKDGLVVKERDDLMSATRVAHMMLRYARPRAARSWDGPGTGWVV